MKILQPRDVVNSGTYNEKWGNEKLGVTGGAWSILLSVIVYNNPIGKLRF